MNRFEEIMSWGIRDWLIAILIIGIVMALGLFSVNQYLVFRYRAEILSIPCDLCRELNPQLEDCFHIKTDMKNSSYEQINISEIEHLFRSSNST